MKRTTARERFPAIHALGQLAVCSGRCPHAVCGRRREAAAVLNEVDNLREHVRDLELSIEWLEQEACELRSAPRGTGEEPPT